MIKNGNNEREIIHLAKVEAVYPEQGKAKVRVSDSSECEACAAASLCSISGEKGSSVLEVLVPQGVCLRKGDTVEIGGTEQLHRKAIRLATVYPTLAILAVMFGLYLLTGNQLVAALGGLGVMILCFGALWLARGRIAREFVFTVRRVSDATGNAPESGK